MTSLSYRQGEYPNFSQDSLLAEARLFLVLTGEKKASINAKIAELLAQVRLRGFWKFDGFLWFSALLLRKEEDRGVKDYGKMQQKETPQGNHYVATLLLPTPRGRGEHPGCVQHRSVASVFEEWQAALQEFLPATLTRMLNKYESRRRLRFPRGTWPGEAPRMETSLV